MIIKKGDVEYDGDLEEFSQNGKTGIKCTCGSINFTVAGIHIDAVHYALTGYTCTECGKPMTIKVYREML